MAALKEQAAGLTREYDRLLDEHSKAQVGIDFLKVVRLVFWSGVVGPGTNELSLARAPRSYDRATRSKARLVSKSKVGNV